MLNSRLWIYVIGSDTRSEIAVNKSLRDYYANKIEFKFVPVFRCNTLGGMGALEKIRDE